MHKSGLWCTATCGVKEVCMKKPTNKAGKPFYKRRRLYIGIGVMFVTMATKETLSLRDSQVEKDNIARIENYIAQKNPRIPIQELNLLSKAIRTYAPQLKIPDSMKIDGEEINKEFLLTAIIYTESHFYRYARSRVGAQGYMQIMPDTANWLASIKRIRGIRQKIWHPDTNISLGVYFINVLIKEMGSLEKALLAYNAGPGAVRAWGGVPAYWNNIVAYYRELKSMAPPEVIPELAALE
ncbi:MAG: lytic transglycosylase domain-containing protein [Candidatus Hydrogenedentota bacterium]|nr:MAG: lytic transglycosylase domain-containing protein [Candidatus Hydrogenedentota bacterium]